MYVQADIGSDDGEVLVFLLEHDTMLRHLCHSINLYC